MDKLLSDVMFLDAVQYIVTALLAALAAWTFAQLAPSTVRGLKDTWHVARKYQPDVIAAVDQPSDPLVHWLSSTTGANAETLARILPRLLRSIADALDEVTNETVSAQVVESQTTTFTAPPPETLPADASTEAVK